MVLTCKTLDALAARLEAAARAEYHSKSEIVRGSLQARLKTSEAAQPGSTYEGVKHLRGVLKSLPNDIATNPEYMRDFDR